MRPLTRDVPTRSAALARARARPTCHTPAAVALQAEILNCRMAMIAFVGMCSAAANRHMGPLACAQAHIDAPFEVNAFTSDVGLELTTAAVVLSIAPFFVIAKQALGDGKEETFNPVPFDFQD